MSLTPRGVAFAEAVVAAIDSLNRELAERIDPERLRAADAVLRAALPDQTARDLALRLVPRRPRRQG